VVLLKQVGCPEYGDERTDADDDEVLGLVTRNPSNRNLFPEPKNLETINPAPLIAAV